MHPVVVAAACLLLAGLVPALPAVAQESAVQSIASRPPLGRIRTLPDLEPVRRVFAQSGVGEANMLLMVSFEADGRVTRASVVEGFVDPMVDTVVADVGGSGSGQQRAQAEP